MYCNVPGINLEAKKTFSALDKIGIGEIKKLIRTCSRYFQKVSRYRYFFRYSPKIVSRYRHKIQNIVSRYRYLNRSDLYILKSGKKSSHLEI